MVGWSILSLISYFSRDHVDVKFSCMEPNEGVWTRQQTLPSSFVCHQPDEPVGSPGSTGTEVERVIIRSSQSVSFSPWYTSDGVACMVPFDRSPTSSTVHGRALLFVKSVEPMVIEAG